MEDKLLLSLTYAALAANINRESYSVGQTDKGFSVKPFSIHDRDALRVSPAGQIFRQEVLIGHIKDFRQPCKHTVEIA